MGFFDFLRKGKKGREDKTRETKPIKLTMDTLPGWIDERLSDRITETDARAKKMCSGIVKRFSDIEKSVRAMENASFETGDKTYAAVNMVKSLFVKRSYSLLGSVPTVPEKPSYSELEEFHSASVKLLGNLKKMSPKQAVLLSNYFRRESAGIFNNFKGAEKDLDGLKDFLKTNAKIKETAEAVLSMADEQRKMEKQLGFLKGKQKDLEAKARALAKTKEQQKGELSRLTGGQEWKGMEKMNREMGELDVRISDLESEIGQELSAINRPLKKLEHMASSMGTDGYSLTPENRKLLEGFLSSPLKAIIQDQAEAGLKDILRITNELVSEKRIMLKQKDHEKMLEFIRKLETQIPWMKEKHAKLSKNRQRKGKELEERYPKLLEKKKELEGALSAAETEEERIGSEAGEINTDMENVEKEMQSRKKRLEDMLSDATRAHVVLA